MSVDPMQEVVERQRAAFIQRYGLRPSYEDVQGEITSLLTLSREWDLRWQAWRSGAEWMRGEAAKEIYRAAELWNTPESDFYAFRIESLPLLPEGKKEPK